MNLAYVLRSALGMTHVLQLGLVMDFNSIEAQCVTTLLPLGDCHTMDIFMLHTSMDPSEVMTYAGMYEI